MESQKCQQTLLNFWNLTFSKIVENQDFDAWDKCVLNEAPADSKPWESLTWPSYEQVFWHLDKMLVGAAVLSRGEMRRMTTQSQ